MNTVLDRAHKPATAVDQRPRVLVVEDDAIVRMILEDICVKHGWDARTAATAAAALVAAGVQDINLVLLDLNLDETNAEPLDTLRALRVMCPTTPIVVITGQSPESLESVAHAGGQGVVGKPCSVAEVAALLRRFHPAAVSR